MKTTALLAFVLAWSAAAQSSGPTANPALLTFTYQVNSTTFPTPAKLTVSLPASASSATVMSVAVTSNPVGSAAPGWLTVTPDSGKTPLALTVTINPTGLAPGSYSGILKVTTNPSVGTTSVVVNLSVTNPPSKLVVTSPPTSQPLADTNPTLTFTYITGDAAPNPLNAELDVASNGTTIPFNVTAANTGSSGSGTSKLPVWLRVNVTNQLPSVQTSGVALSGSYVPITVSIDYTTLAALDVGPYTATVTIAANNVANGTYTAAVNLSVAAGPPTLDPILPIFPSSVVAGPAIDPVITIYGNNFFSTTSVVMTPDGGADLPLAPKFLSRKVLQVTVPKAYFASAGNWTLKVMNGNNGTGPQEDWTSFEVVATSVPIISSIANAASYSKTARQTGTITNPVPSTGAGSTSISPREIVSIFGQNLGPADITPATVIPGFPDVYPPTAGTPAVSVWFQAGMDPPVQAPLIMVSSNQINAIVPTAVASAIGVPAPNATVQVVYGATMTDPFPVTVVAADPGAFTYGGSGQGQAAVLNYDINTGYTINGTKNLAPRGSTIVIYATGLGDLVGGATVSVSDSSSPAQSVTTTSPLSLTITGAPAPTGSLNITTPGALGNGTLNIPYVPTTLTAQGGTVPYTWTSTGLPPGMYITPTGLVGGTPTVAGTYAISITVTDKSLPPLSTVSGLSLTIVPGLTITTASLPQGVAGIPYVGAALQAEGGIPPYTWALDAATPVAGMSVSPTGVWSGTPTAAGGYNPVFTVTDSSMPALTYTAGYPLNITANMVIVNSFLPNGAVNAAYPGTTLQGQGGTPPYTWSAVGLPAGVTIDVNTGALGGRPTASGLFNPTITMTDSATLTASTTYPMTISSALNILTTALPSGSAYVAYQATQLQASGGTPPYRWTASGLPAGMSLTQTGVLSGTPLNSQVLPLPDGAVAIGALSVSDNTYRVDIDGQPSVVTYVGASKGSVAGLMQLNAIVPNTARIGPAIPLTISIGGPARARTSQINVTLGVK